MLIFPEARMIKEEICEMNNNNALDINNGHSFLKPITFMKESLEMFNKNRLNPFFKENKDQFLESLYFCTLNWEGIRNSFASADKKLIIRDDEKLMIRSLAYEYGIVTSESFSSEYTPGIRLMNYVKWQKCFLSKKQITMNDIVDFKISCIVPYMDTVITERFQGDIYRQSKSLIPQMKNVEILGLKDLRNLDHTKFNSCYP